MVRRLPFWLRVLRSYCQTAQPSKAVPVETQHEDMIHDAQLDYYGKRLATCSSDKTIRIFNVIRGEAKGEPVILKGHSAAVWSVAWAHPSFGSILASCSYDGRVFIWKEVGSGQAKGGGGELQDGWERIKEHTLHTASVNSISWAPYDLGPILVCGSSDGKVSVLTFQNDGSTDASIFPAHGTGANAVSWAPSVVFTAPLQATATSRPAGPTSSSQLAVQKRFVSGGNDNLIRIWTYDDVAKKWEEEEVIKGHDDWVRDVAWAPNIGLPGMYIASASQRAIFWPLAVPMEKSVCGKKASTMCGSVLHYIIPAPPQVKTPESQLGVASNAMDTNSPAGVKTTKSQLAPVEIQVVPHFVPQVIPHFVPQFIVPQVVPQGVFSNTSSDKR
ncbi:protein transporter SEC13 [Tremella mesenterica]|uniref:Protein transporter SEC13 n=1 Tax=Tremella mesenterica TaxID=5217 RepID=A0A4V1M350_TREME|nr:protein transporter SEC13 [Tremella mesenterica]